ncbi:hypothetical protein [Natrinema salsiterrestre]|uniref:Uncharacterized protein n=1 Tax=Natrinema salsiterrestre TaxID=2950540 RepID=A0A9Q4L9C4_9EURY|nr:hypothetical protein [Natrinema salsiterrestre]MDF9748430.1 hypothetical protein [Natrinema salsiterrestre]
MKPGAGDDLLSDDDDDQEDVDDAAVEDSVDDLLAGEDEGSDESDTAASSENNGYSLPWIHRRNTVKSDRSEVIQLHVREPTVDGEADLHDDVEDILDEDVYALDLREAAYLVAMQHPDEVADQLREWGYDFE